MVTTAVVPLYIITCCRLLHATEFRKADERGKCKWNVNYSLRPIQNSSSLRLHYKPTEGSCHQDGFRLELLRTLWTNVTSCKNRDHLYGVHIKNTKEDSFLFKNVTTGNYCVVIEPLGINCRQCNPAISKRSVFLSSSVVNAEPKAVNVRESQLKTADALDALGLFVLTVAAIILSFILIFTIIYFVRRRFRQTIAILIEDIPSEERKSCPRNLEEDELFLLHTRDAIFRSEKLRKQLGPPASTLLNKFFLNCIASDWIVNRLKRGKIVLVESKDAYKIYLDRVELVSSLPEILPTDDNLGSIDDAFRIGLSAIMTSNLNTDFDRLFVVHFPYAGQPLPPMKQILGGKRYQMPSQFVELCRDLTDHTNCQDCTKRWRETAESLEFILKMQMTS